MPVHGVHEWVAGALAARTDGLHHCQWAARGRQRLPVGSAWLGSLKAGPRYDCVGS